MPCSAITNKAKLKSAIDNFDRILNEYAKRPNAATEIPKLKKAKTCSIIESKCILKKSLSTENNLSQTVSSTNNKKLDDDSRNKSRSLFDIDNEEALILSALSPVLKQPLKRVAANKIVDTKSDLTNNKVKGVISKLNLIQNCGKVSTTTKEEKNVSTEKKSSQVLKKSNSYNSSKDAVKKDNAIKPIKPSKTKIVDNRETLDFAEKKNQLISKFNQNCNIKPSRINQTSLSKSTQSIFNKIDYVKKPDEAKSKKFDSSTFKRCDSKRDLSLNHQTDRDLAEVITTSNDTIVKRSFIPRATSCQDVSQRKTPTVSSRIPVKNCTPTVQGAIHRTFPSTPTGLHLLDRCSDVTAIGSRSRFGGSVQQQQQQQPLAVWKQQRASAGCDVGATKPARTTPPPPPQAKPRMSLFGVKKHQVDSKYIESLPKPRNIIKRSDTYTKTTHTPHLQLKVAHLQVETSPNYHQVTELTVETPMHTSAVTVTDQVTVTLRNCHRTQTESHIDDVKGYASDDAHSDDSGNISTELDVEDCKVGLYSSAESLSARSVPSREGVISTTNATCSEQIFLRTTTVTELESARDQRLHEPIVRLQAAARGLLARRRLHQLRLQAIAVRCIQRNVRKHQLVRHWPWWRLLLRLQPLLNVNRVEDELKAKTEELQAVKAKLEKIEADRSYLKLENDKLESKTLSPIPAHMEDSTPSSYLTNKIADFLTRTDHVMDEWRHLGGNRRSVDSDVRGSNSRLGRSRSAANIMIRGFQYYSQSRASSVSRGSVTRDCSVDCTELDEISEITADLADEHSAATLASERLESETAERLRLERELTEAQVRNERLERTGERLEMELLYARADLNGSSTGGAGSSIVSEDGSSSVGGDDEDGAGNGGQDGYYKERYQRALRELQFTKRRLQQQHEDDLDQLVGLKKQLEKKLADAHEQTAEQRAATAQWKRRVAKVTGELTDVKLVLETQMARNSLLEKRQRKFDADLQAVNDGLRQERAARERAQRDMEAGLQREVALETELADVKHDLDAQSDRLRQVELEADGKPGSGSCGEDEAATLRRLRVENERRLQEQEQELDDLAGQVQLLEAAKLRLEMSLEQHRKRSKLDSAQHEEELEEARSHAQKKVKLLEQQLEAEQAERSLLLRDKREAERRLSALVDQQREEGGATVALVARLKRDLRRTKALLGDAHAQLQHLGKAGHDQHKAQIRQLRNQLDDSEVGRASAVKAKAKAVEELLEKEAALDESVRGRREAEESLAIARREWGMCQGRLEETEEEMASVLQRHRHTLTQQHHDHQITIQAHLASIGDLHTEVNQLQDQIQDLNAKLQHALIHSNSTNSIGSDVSVGGEMTIGDRQRVKEVEARLELEQTVRSRLELQLGREKERVERAAREADGARQGQREAEEGVRKLQRTLREIREEQSATVTREADTAAKLREADARATTAQSETDATRAELRLAQQRLDALQLAMAQDLDSQDDDDDDDDDEDNFSASSSSDGDNTVGAAAVTGVVVSGTTQQQRQQNGRR